jgi:hypothetical protein
MSAERELLDSDGENRAVRGLLLGLEMGILHFGPMRDHMRRYGWPQMPDGYEALEGHMSKGAKQKWLRHLFNLEAADRIAAYEALLMQVRDALESYPYNDDFYQRTIKPLIAALTQRLENKA